jgi:hypothetical protein
MRVVEFECGCVGLRDFDTEETIIFRECSNSEHLRFDLTMNYKDKTCTALSENDQSIWMARIRILIAEGEDLRRVRKIMRGIR